MTIAWAGVGAAVGLFAGVVSMAPASWLAQALSTVTQERMQLHGNSGTVWSGQGQLLVGGGPGSQASMALPGRVAWRLRPYWDHIGLELSASCCTDAPLQARLTPRWGNVELVLDDATSRWPAAILAGLGAPWNTIGLQGALQLKSEGLSLKWAGSGWLMSGAAQLDALGVTSSLSTLRPLGSYRLRLQAAASAPTVRLQTLDGNLQLSGDGQWTGSQWRFLGEARADGQSEEVLGNLLNIIGRRQGPRSVMSFG
ncbi:MAG: type II secretion system protein N [Rhodoferax sp.]|nr:type II secretion system protein N [Rhodoferax sp.]